MNDCPRGNPCSHGCARGDPYGFESIQLMGFPAALSSSAIECSCPVGMVLNMDGTTCEVVNQCLNNNGGCSHECINTQNGFECHCPEGTTLRGFLIYMQILRIEPIVFPLIFLRFVFSKKKKMNF